MQNHLNNRPKKATIIYILAFVAAAAFFWACGAGAWQNAGDRLEFALHRIANDVRVWAEGPGAELSPPEGVIPKGSLGGEALTHTEAGLGTFTLDVTHKDKGVAYLGFDLTGLRAEDVRIVFSKRGVEIGDDLGLAARRYKQGFYPLIYGPGDYTLTAYRKAEGKRDSYVEIFSRSFTANFSEGEPYRYSNADTEYAEGSEVALAAARLTKYLGTDEAKAAALAAWVSKNIKYDFGMGNDAIMAGRSLDYYVSRGKGVCKQYAEVLAGMLKCVGIPARVVWGYNGEAEGSAYHAWVEAFVAGAWVSMDAGVTPSMPSFATTMDDFSAPCREYVRDSFTER
jgi:hypothetical protein